MDDLLEPGGALMPANTALTVADQAIAGGHAMQQVKTGYTTAIAVQRPREMADVERRLMNEAAIGGELMYYGWGAGKDRIEGPSWELAVAAARCYGNCAVDQEPMQETPDAWVFTSTFVDVETGFTIKRQFRQSKKWTVHGKLDAERKDDMRFQIGQSKAIRNVILSALPKWMIDKALRRAKEGVRNKLEAYIRSNGKPAAVEIICRALAKHGVKPEQIAAKFDVATVEGLTVEHLITIKGDLGALDNGEARAGELYPAADKNAKQDDTGDALAKQLGEPAAARQKRTNRKKAEPEQAPEPSSQANLDNSDDGDGAPPDVIMDEWRQAIEAADSLAQLGELKQKAQALHVALRTEVVALCNAAAEAIRGSRGSRSNGR